MKKAIFGFGLLMSALAFANVDNKVILFSTPGPDTYKDGTAVLDGEYYALVWTRAGKTFEGVDTCGNAVGGDSRVLLKAPVAKGGRCPLVQFQLNAGFCAKNGISSGTLAVYLLDSRKFKAGADGVLLKDADGRFIAESCGQTGNPVNGYGETGATISASAGLCAFDVAGGVAATAVAEAVESGKNAKVEKIELKEGRVYLHVSGVSSSVIYGIQAGERPTAVDQDLGSRYGTSTGEMIIVRDQKAGGEFFKFIRK